VSIRAVLAVWAVAARLSRRLRRALTVALLAVAYLTLVPPLALLRRLRRAPPSGWHDRDDPTVATLDRLRARF